MPGPLAHLAVLDHTCVLAGRWRARAFADPGATAIGTEKAGTGDDAPGIVGVR